DDAELYARRLLVKFSDSASLLKLLGDIAFRQRDLWTAAVCFDAAQTLEAGNVETEKKLQAARSYGRISGGFSRPGIFVEQSRKQADYAVLVLNLDSDTDQRRHVQYQLTDCPVPVYGVPDVPGSYLAKVGAGWLAGSRNPSEADVATMLSHVAAWEGVLA